MLVDFKNLVQQIFENEFKDMLFSIYNFADEEFYVHNLEKLGYEGDIDSLEYVILDRTGFSDNDLKSFKKYVEGELQNDKVVLGILLYNGKKGLLPIVIKPKTVNIETILIKN